MKKKAILLLIAIMVIGLLSACGGSSSGSSAAPAEENKDDRELVMTITKDLTTLDPFKCTGSSSWRVCRSIYDCPWVFDDAGTIHYRACTAYEFSEDGKSMTVTLRDGLKFENGEPITVEDLAYTIEKCKEGPITTTWANYVTDEEVIDGHTLKINLDRVYAPLALSMQDVTIVPKAAHEAAGGDFGYEPVCSGPYVLDEYKVGDSVSMKANENFTYQEVSVKHVKYKLIAEPATVSAALQNGEVQYTSNYAKTDFDTLSKLEGMQVLENRERSYEFATYNVTIAPFDNADFRQAINYALDRQSMIDIVQEGDGYIEYNIWNDQVFGYKQMEGWPYNVDKAKEYLEKAGYPNGEGVPEQTIYCYGDTGAKEAQVIQDSLKAIGIDWPVEQVDMNFLWDGQTDGSIAFSVDGMGLGIDASEYATMLVTDGGFNSAWYSNPKVDELFDLASGTIDEQERKDYYGQIIDIEQEDAPYMVLYYEISKTLCTDELDLSEAKAYSYVYPQYLKWK